jgi:hypothetical protein
MKELRDQAAHVAAAIIVLLPLALFLNPLAGAVSGFGLGLIRELTEEGPINPENLKDALGSKLDLTFWALGGAIVGIIA